MPSPAKRSRIQEQDALSARSGRVPVPPASSADRFTHLARSFEQCLAWVREHEEDMLYALGCCRSRSDIAAIVGEEALAALAGPAFSQGALLEAMVTVQKWSTQQLAEACGFNLGAVAAKLLVEDAVRGSHRIPVEVWTGAQLEKRSRPQTTGELHRYWRGVAVPAVLKTIERLAEPEADDPWSVVAGQIAVCNALASMLGEATDETAGQGRPQQDQPAQQPQSPSEEKAKSLPKTSPEQTGDLLLQYLRKHRGGWANLRQAAEIVQRNGLPAGPKVRTCSVSTVSKAIRLPDEKYQTLRDQAKFKPTKSKASTVPEQPATDDLGNIRHVMHTLLSNDGLPDDVRDILNGRDEAAAHKWIRENPHRVRSFMQENTGEQHEGQEGSKD